MSKLYPDREEKGEDGTVRKAHYGTGRQPWDDIRDAGWGPQFLAASILRYLRRDKDREHSLESARRYWSWLSDLGAKATDDDPVHAVAATLHDLLTAEERSLLNVGTEISVDEFDEFSTRNWSLVPEDQRRRCLDEIRRRCSPEMAAGWRDQMKRAVRIGSDDSWFHMGIGMQVRNALRKIVPDHELPDVLQDDGTVARNWDDFYMGALMEFASS